MTFINLRSLVAVIMSSSSRGARDVRRLCSSRRLAFWSSLSCLIFCHPCLRRQAWWNVPAGWILRVVVDRARRIVADVVEAGACFDFWFHENSPFCVYTCVLLATVVAVSVPAVQEFLVHEMCLESLAASTGASFS
jgi:hypothetical protein